MFSTIYVMTFSMLCVSVLGVGSHPLTASAPRAMRRGNQQLQAVRVTQLSSNRGSGVTSLCSLGPQGHAVHVNHVLSYTYTYANFLTKA